MDEQLFKKVPVKVQSKSGFDLSFQNLLTTKVGTITPLLCEEVIPNETVHLRAAIQAQLPPLASDTFMRCNLKYEAFFVPTRLIFPGFEKWLLPNASSSPATDPSGNYSPVAPTVTLTSTECARGTLADYLGVKSNTPTGYTTETNKTITVNALPFIAYHKIWSDWYRNSLIQKEPFYDSFYATYTSYNAVGALAVVPNTTHGSSFSQNSSTIATAGNKRLADNVVITALRQRNFGIDYFTSATSSPQNGSQQGLAMTVSNNAAGFTIAQLRAANSIQQFLERNNLAGNRLVDYVKAQYGANLSDGIAQRSVLLGSGQFAVYSKGIYQTSTDLTQQVTDGAKNPFAGTPAAQFGSAFASGEETLIDSFTAMEPGYIFVMVTLVPKVTYSTGIDRKLIRYTSNDSSDMANPILQGVGNQPIFKSELLTDDAFISSDLKNSVFGYTERYADWKSKNDEIHGLLRENNTYNSWASGVGTDTGGTLQSFALQSAFDYSSPNLQISSDFLQIPTTYLDNVSATGIKISNYGCWIDSYLDFKVSMPLARYSLPSLQDPAYEHGDTVVLDRGGRRL